MDKNLLTIPSTTTATECYELWKLASLLQPKSVLVELGTGAGRVTAILASAVAGKGSILYTVDNYSYEDKYGIYKWNSDVALENLKKFNLDGHTKFLVGESTKVAQEFAEKIDFLFVDAGHRYIEVCNDFDAWIPKINPGGIISGHDFDPNCDDGRNVIKAIFDKLLTNPNKQMVVRERIWWMEK